jgi:hypothetical protein
MDTGDALQTESDNFLNTVEPHYNGLIGAKDCPF